MSTNIAKFLKLDNPKTYTGHALRRSAAILLADCGADITRSLKNTYAYLSWELKGLHCYKFFNIRHSWEKAAELCRRAWGIETTSEWQIQITAKPSILLKTVSGKPVIYQIRIRAGPVTDKLYSSTSGTRVINSLE
ncbi:hypothetical protein NQ317_011252 [Molorchus minor]|uniref:Tyr recombinase domain-containing protein n=1 Tax=Molorchus minor TaxID=1323400 RepID=A0ABQ9JKA4_9CUCU|nr:hypothetical protein NQ317_011252 [Molorchus minor]